MLKNLSVAAVLVSPPMAAMAQGVDSSTTIEVRRVIQGFEQAVAARDITKVEQVVAPDIVVFENGGRNDGWADFRDNHRWAVARSSPGRIRIRGEWMFDVEAVLNPAAWRASKFSGSRQVDMVHAASECPSGCRCAGKTGEVVRMEVSYGEGVATHTGPESCAVVRKGGGEALTGVDAGRVLCRENCGLLRGADAVDTGGRLHRARRHRETRTDPARSETPSTHGNTSHGSREIPRLPAARGAAGRTGKSEDASR